MKKARKQVTTGTPKQSGTPCAMVLRLIPRSPRSAGLVSLRRRRIFSGRLDPSVGGSGPHGFAVRTGLARLALSARPPHPAPTFVAIGQTPLQAETGRADRTTHF